jgi:arylsulfatase A-like enzyme/Flp pilus assembly protein TadD
VKRDKRGWGLPRALFCAILIASLSAGETVSGERMNVLLISIDTLRADRLSCYGGTTVQTRAIDSLARKGVLFERAFAHTPLTLPSHTNLLTGTLPTVHGVHDNIGFRVPLDSLNLAEHLKAQGYTTAAFVSADPLHSSFGLARGFDLYDDFFAPANLSNSFSYGERKGADTVSKAVDWIGRHKDLRWFLFLHLFDPHQPYAPPEPFAREYAADLYGGEVAYVDDCLGKLFRYLDASGLTAKTLIVLTADHGESLGEHGELTHGYFAYNSTLHVPLILRADALLPAGKVDRHLISHIDVFPTICDLLRVKKPGVLQGQSLLPLLQGLPFSEKPVYFESLEAYYGNNWAPLRGVIRGHVKFIDLPLPELYDLDSDFQEKNNLASKRSTDDDRKVLHEFLATAKRPMEPRALKEDPRVLEKMRSLGYLAAGGGPRKTGFSEKDDLKTLLPYYQKLVDSVVFSSQGDNPRAVRILKELIREKADYLTAYECLAAIYAQMSQYEEAVKTLEAALVEAPGDVHMKGLLGLYLSQGGNQEAAIKKLRAALETDPQDAELWTNLGVACWKSGRLDEAKESYLKALALDKNDAGLLNNLGTLALSQKDLDKAWDYFNRAVAIDSNLASAWNGKGAVLDGKADLPGAVECWKKAVSLNPNHEMALYNIGMALLRLNRPAEALAPLENYLRVTRPDSPDRARVSELVKSIKQHRPPL